MKQGETSVETTNAMRTEGRECGFAKRGRRLSPLGLLPSEGDTEQGGVEGKGKRTNHKSLQRVGATTAGKGLSGRVPYRPRLNPRNTKIGCASVRMPEILENGGGREIGRGRVVRGSEGKRSQPPRWACQRKSTNHFYKFEGHVLRRNLDRH